jgi:hypothetical protein
MLILLYEIGDVEDHTPVSAHFKRDYGSTASTLCFMADEERVSLSGVDPEEALRALLKVDPESPPVESERRPKRRPSESKGKREPEAQ